MSHKPIKKGDQNKAWNRYRPKPTRSINTKSERETFLIVCEGKRTEPSYFNAFRLTSATVRTEGLGMNTLSLVNRCIALVNQHRGRGDSMTRCGAYLTAIAFRHRTSTKPLFLPKQTTFGWHGATRPLSCGMSFILACSKRLATDISTLVN